MHDVELDRRVESLARRQHYAFNRAQVIALRGSDKQIQTRVERGSWVRSRPGVYYLAASPATWWRTLALAVLAHPRPVITGKSACALHELTGFRPCRPELTVPVGAHHVDRLAIIRQSNLTATTWVRGLPTSTVEQAIIECAGRVAPTVLRTAVEDALAARCTTVESLGGRFAAVADTRWRGIGAIRHLLGELGPGFVPPGSELERRFYAILDDAPIPPYRRQAPAPWSAGERVDAVIDEWRLILEADGRAWHSRLRDMDNDRRRDNRAHACGYGVLRFGWEDVFHHPADLVAIVLATGTGLPWWELGRSGDVVP